MNRQKFNFLIFKNKKVSSDRLRVSVAEKKCAKIINFSNYEVIFKKLVS